MSEFGWYQNNVTITRNRERQCWVSRIRVESVTETKSNVHARMETHINSFALMVTVGLIVALSARDAHRKKKKKRKKCIKGMPVFK